MPADAEKRTCRQRVRRPVFCRLQQSALVYAGMRMNRRRRSRDQTLIRHERANVAVNPATVAGPTPLAAFRFGIAGLTPAAPPRPRIVAGLSFATLEPREPR